MLDAYLSVDILNTFQSNFPYVWAFRKKPFTFPLVCTFHPCPAICSHRFGQTLLLLLLLVAGFVPSSILTVQNFMNLLETTSVYDDHVFVTEMLSEIGECNVYSFSVSASWCSFQPMP